jgi:hypothetical protein
MGATLYFFVEADDEATAIERARSLARDIVADEDEFDGIGPLVEIPEDADETAFIERLAGEDDAFVERHRSWYADPTDEVEESRLDRLLSMPLGRRFYDLRGDGTDRVTSRDHADELLSLDDPGVYFVPVGVERAFRPPSERD